MSADTEAYVKGSGLKGFLAKESDEEIKVAVPGGYWIIPRKHVESMVDWPDPIGTFDGRPIIVEVKLGAELGWLQTVRMDAKERPMTLPEQASRIVGNESLRLLSDMWASNVGLEAMVAVEGSPSACCWETDGWGMACQADDCRD